MNLFRFCSSSYTSLVPLFGWLNEKTFSGTPLPRPTALPKEITGLAYPSYWSHQGRVKRSVPFCEFVAPSVCTQKHHPDSNTSLNDWGVVLGDLTVATAVLDRLLHHCTPVSIVGDGYRLNKDHEKQTVQQKIISYRDGSIKRWSAAHISRRLTV